MTINKHALQLNRSIDEFRTEDEILIDEVVNSQNGVIQLQLIKTVKILEQVKIRQADMPSNLSLPIPTSATYQRLVLRIVSLDVFLKGHFLVYVIRLPLTNKVIYKLHHVLPLPIKIREQIQNLYLSNLNMTIC